MLRKTIPANPDVSAMSRLFRTAVPMLALAALACAAAAPASGRAAPSAVRGDTTALRRTLEGVMRGYAGVAGVSVANLRTGETLSIRGGETYPSASLIKVAILVALLDEV
ncbi:MAG TPA: serine hydrolase, partial [Longimicrobium sp.]